MRPLSMDVLFPLALFWYHGTSRYLFSGGWRGSYGTSTRHSRAPAQRTLFANQHHEQQPHHRHEPRPRMSPQPRPPPPDQAGGSAWQGYGPTSSYEYRPQSPPEYRGPAPDYGTYIVFIFQLGVRISYVLMIPSVGAYGYHTATSGHQASGSGSGWGSDQEARAHAGEEMYNWMNIFNTPEFPTQPHIQQTPPPYPTQGTQDDDDLTVPRQTRAPNRYGRTPPVQPPPRDPRPRRRQ